MIFFIFKNKNYKSYKVERCPECYSDLDFNGNCPICNLRKSHGRRKMMRKNNKEKRFKKKIDIYYDYYDELHESDDDNF